MGQSRDRWLLQGQIQKDRAAAISVPLLFAWSIAFDAGYAKQALCTCCTSPVVCAF